MVERWSCIVLAAGRSSRMGPRHKLLEVIDDKPVIRHVCDQVRRAGFEQVLMVTGYQAEAVHLAAGPIQTCFNPDYASGLSSSLRVGLQHVDHDSAGAFLVLGDMPFIAAATFKALRDQLEAAPSKLGLVPVVEGEWAHPVGVRRVLFDAIMNRSGDQGGRAVLKAHQADLILWPSEDPGLLFDVDTPEALQKARADRAAVGLKKS